MFAINAESKFGPIINTSRRQSMQQILRYSYNLIFAVFNLIPLPPLDGSKVLMNLLPGRQASMFEKIEPYAPFILLALVYLHIINIIISPLYKGLDFIMYQIVMMIF